MRQSRASIKDGGRKVQSLRMWNPPSAFRTVPVPKSISPLAAARTQFATSSGVPQRLIGVIPSAISLSYFCYTTSVIGVLMMPGRTSNTGIPNSASLSANRVVIIETPAFEMQYSPRLVLDV